MVQSISFFAARAIPAVAVAALAALAACSPAPPGVDIHDPYEARNRRVHDVNRGIDRAVIRGASGAYGKAVPEPVRRGVSNFASNLSLPGEVVNSLLQGRPEPAVQNTFRFIINSTLGVAGLFDPATSIGVPEEETDFGETLHVWGAPEGAFLVVPVAGPTTERDLVGKVVDFVIDPMGGVFPEPEKYYVAAAKLGGKAADRQRYGDTIDSILYESADSYAQMRLLYLQNRHYELGIEAEVFDPYEDPYGQ